MRSALLGTFVVAALFAPVAAVGYAVERLDLPSWLVWVVGLPLALATLVGAPLRVLRSAHRRTLLAQPLDELRAAAFAVHDAYFDEIRATEDPAYRRLVALSEARDVDGLLAEWPTLTARFRALEHASGHNGRPLILDYYDPHHDDLKVLRTRLRRRAGSA